MVRAVSSGMPFLSSIILKSGLEIHSRCIANKTYSQRKDQQAIVKEVVSTYVSCHAAVFSFTIHNSIRNH